MFGGMQPQLVGSNVKAVQVTGAVSFGLPAYQDREKAPLLTKLTSSYMLVAIAVSFSTEIMCVMV
jgi:hypothetical protein